MKTEQELRKLALELAIKEKTGKDPEIADEIGTIDLANQNYYFLKEGRSKESTNELQYSKLHAGIPENNIPVFIETFPLRPNNFKTVKVSIILKKRYSDVSPQYCYHVDDQMCWSASSKVNSFFDNANTALEFINKLKKSEVDWVVIKLV